LVKDFSLRIKRKVWVQNIPQLAKDILNSLLNKIPFEDIQMTYMENKSASDTSKKGIKPTYKDPLSSHSQ
jgi:hypothetical protein